MCEHGKIESPCVDVCTLDPATQLCIGCYRTIEEIAGWASYSDEQRSAVQAALSARRVKFNFSETLAQGPVMPQRPAASARCGGCGAEITCGALTPGRRCWCESFPAVTAPIRSGDSCLCPVCLASAAVFSGA